MNKERITAESCFLPENNGQEFIRTLGIAGGKINGRLRHAGNDGGKDYFNSWWLLGFEGEMRL